MLFDSRLRERIGNVIELSVAMSKQGKVSKKFGSDILRSRVGWHPYESIRRSLVNRSKDQVENASQGPLSSSSKGLAPVNSVDTWLTINPVGSAWLGQHGSL
jgi:hypothetical protein